MSLESAFRPNPNQIFWPTQRTLIHRLRFLLPDLNWKSVNIDTQPLVSNASFVNFVQHHRITDSTTGESVDIVEKSVRKILFITSLEARFHREGNILGESKYFRHPRCFGVIDTPLESFIYTQFVCGRSPYMHAIASEVGRGIAEIENLSSAYLTDKDTKKIKYWVMDFFHPWYLLRPRFRYNRFFNNLSRLAAVDSRFEGYEQKIRSFGPELLDCANAAKPSQKAFCHMDYLRKNLFVSSRGLELIDWSEAKIGRIGFDGGSYLSALFRRNDMDIFLKAREEFIRAYIDTLSPKLDKLVAIQNMRYIFILGSLWYCMRSETISEHQENFRMGLLWEKLDFLCSLQSTTYP